MKILAITQARTGSTRLPNKVLKTVEGKTLLQIHLERILRSKRIDTLMIATTTEQADTAIAQLAEQMHLPCYRGSVNDVLDRFYQAAKQHQAEWVVRLTSDCPLIDPDLIDKIIEQAIQKKLDYFSNTLLSGFPDGEDIEVFTFQALEKAWKEATIQSDREHVTPYIHRNSSFHGKSPFKSDNFPNTHTYAEVRLTVDEEKDFEVIQSLIQKLGTDRDWKTYADLYLSDPAIRSLNQTIKRNEGYTF